MDPHHAAIEQFVLPDDGTFPNSRLPVLLYKDVLDIPVLFKAAHVKNLFDRNGWTNSWEAGILTCHHYHSIAHEVLGVYRGRTNLQLGGPDGPEIGIEKGDVLVIPAGVAHKNLGAENSVGVVGAYPGGSNYDMNFGKPGERPATDINIANVQQPLHDPLYGFGGPLVHLWKRSPRETVLELGSPSP